MTEIAEFLLARIAEDEAPTWEFIPYACEPGCCAHAGYVGHRCLICDVTSFGGTPDAIAEISREHEENIHRRSRVLAECAAKRQIVAALTEADRDGSGRYEEGYGLTTATQHLAAVYADHPDYDEEWRP